MQSKAGLFGQTTLHGFTESGLPFPTLFPHFKLPKPAPITLTHITPQTPFIALSSSYITHYLSP